MQCSSPIPRRPPQAKAATAIEYGLIASLIAVVFITATASLNDTDGDGVHDHIDNCPTVFNPGQEECGSNGIGDACEFLANPQSMNTDGIKVTGPFQSFPGGPFDSFYGSASESGGFSCDHAAAAAANSVLQTITCSGEGVIFGSGAEPTTSNWTLVVKAEDDGDTIQWGTFSFS